MVSMLVWAYLKKPQLYVQLIHSMETRSKKIKCDPLGTRGSCEDVDKNLKGKLNHWKYKFEMAS